MAGKELNRRHQDFQTRLHPPAQTSNMLVSVMIRSLRSIDLHSSFRIRPDGEGQFGPSRVRADPDSMGEVRFSTGSPNWWHMSYCSNSGVGPNGMTIAAPL